MQSKTTKLGTAISKRHREALDAIRRKTGVSIRALIESWIDTESACISSKKRRAKA